MPEQEQQQSEALSPSGETPAVEIPEPAGAEAPQSREEVSLTVDEPAAPAETAPEPPAPGEQEPAAAEPAAAPLEMAPEPAAQQPPAAVEAEPAPAAPPRPERGRGREPRERGQRQQPEKTAAERPGRERGERRAGERPGPDRERGRGDRPDRDRGDRRPDRDRRPDGPIEADYDKLLSDSLYLDNLAHALVGRMRDLDTGTRSQLRRLYGSVRRACRAGETDRQHQFVMLRARLAYTIARHGLRSLDPLEKLLLAVTRRNESRGYDRFRDLFEAIIAYNE